jgi:hypothetical protein
MTLALASIARQRHSLSQNLMRSAPCPANVREMDKAEFPE